jgi:hypothetical protein
MLEWIALLFSWHLTIGLWVGMFTVGFFIATDRCNKIYQFDVLCISIVAGIIWPFTVLVFTLVFLDKFNVLAYIEKLRTR